jgi:DNA (cytosine-5)-methyltransferase 1
MSVSKTKQKKKYDKPTVISLFTCGMGMDRGFEEAGFQTVYANDITKFACKTIQSIKKKEIEKEKLHLDEGSIFDIDSKSILENIGLEKEEPDLIIGGPPCQSFSTAGKRKGIKDDRGKAVLEYIKKINEIRPKAFVFENVQGITSMAKSPMSFYDRIQMKDSELNNSQKKGSLFRYIENKFNELKTPKEGMGYTIQHEILIAADFGIPQNRKRFVLIGIRKDVGDAEQIMIQIKSKAKYADPRKAEKLGKKPWLTLETLKNKFEGKIPEEGVNFSSNTMKFLKYVPKKTGGCWIDLPKKLQVEAMGGAADTDDPKRKGKQGGRRGFYRRLSWKKPSPTLVTSPTQSGTLMCHPEYDRPLSVKEYAVIQGFPDNWKFQGSLADRYRMIGEAVPVKLAKIIAKTIKDSI